MPDKTFSDVHLEAEQVTEMHRTLNNDHTVTEVELPGLVNVYLVIDGGKVLLDQLKAPVVLEAIGVAGEAQKAAAAAAAQANTSGDAQAAATPADPSQPQG